MRNRYIDFGPSKSDIEMQRILKKRACILETTYSKKAAKELMEMIGTPKSSPKDTELQFHSSINFTWHFKITSWSKSGNLIATKVTILIPTTYPNEQLEISINNFPMPAVIFKKFLEEYCDVINEYGRIHSSDWSIVGLLTYVKDEFNKMVESYYSKIGLHYNKLYIDKSSEEFALDEIRQRCSRWVESPERHAINPGNIIRALSESYCYKIENVMNLNILTQFEIKKQEFERKYGKDSQCAETTITYHGTNVTSTYGIVESGFLLPKNLTQDIVHGAKYGVGIYSSPNSSYATMYSSPDKFKGSFRLIVCVVLMGNTKNGGYP